MRAKECGLTGGGGEETMYPDDRMDGVADKESPVSFDFLEMMRRRVLVFDGAMGTSIHTYDLDLQRDYAGLENCTEILVRTRPDVIREIHESFLAVGCDVVETDTFGANRIVLGEFGIADQAYELNVLAAKVAREACEKHSTADRPRFVAGSMGPGTKLPSLGQITYDALVESYTEQCRGLLAGGVDLLLIETNQDLLLTKAAIAAATDAMAEAGRKVPLIVQVTIEAFGTMLVGSDISAVVAAMAPFGQVDCLGLNCATGPTEMGEHIQYLSHHWPRAISVLPNAGLPLIVDGKATYPLTPGDFAKALVRFVDDYGVNIVGGCCGTTPEHLRALVELLGDRRPAERKVETAAEVASLYGAEEIEQDNSYLIVAERTNTNGSRKFKRLLEADDWDGLVSMARDEARDGSHVLDVCVDFVGRDGVRDMREVLGRFVRQIRLPIMIDSTDAAVLEAGLKLCGGKCILNSVNLEDGEERVARIVGLAKRYGAALVAGTIDEDKENAMARTAARKLAIALRLHDLIVVKHGLAAGDLLFDPLVLPISTGIEADRRNALETIEGTRLIKKHLPECHTVVGLSNVSFGLKPEARVVLNSAFLNELREAGLTGAIAHVSKILPRTRIADEKWNAAMDLIYDRRREGFDPLTAFVGLFPDGQEAMASGPADESAPIEEKLKRHIIDGEKRDLVKHLEEALGTHPPLAIINDILLEGMKVVGELFGSGRMQLPFVLQSAETMKAAVAHLEPKMDRVAGHTKGRIVLATVKGDVHDIGKNLVDIILTNNGYTVHNLGIKQPVNEILRAAREHSADAVGMSGLLVKSVGVMKENLEEMNAQGIGVPVLLGGAALTRQYATKDLAGLYKGKLFYCRDAFAGLATMDRIMSGDAEGLYGEQQADADRRDELAAKAVRPKETGDLPARSSVATDNAVPTPPFWGARIARDIPVEQIVPYINPNALFIGQWGFKKKGLSDAEYDRLIEETARPVFEGLAARAKSEGFLAPKVAYGYFPVQSEGDEVIVYRPEAFAGCACGGRGGRIAPAGEAVEWMRFSFPRQNTRRRLCVADFFRSRESGLYDVLGVQVVTVGDRSAELAAELFKENRYQDYLYLHGFGVESAEALAEFWHKRMRQELGFGAEDSSRIGELFQQGYRGSRYSFGYGACPDLEDRAKIMELVGGEAIGVSLTENFMLAPEQSTDALVVHHPQARYFDA